jgi:hypothetical protein
MDTGVVTPGVNSTLSAEDTARLRDFMHGLDSWEKPWRPFQIALRFTGTTPGFDEALFLRLLANEDINTPSGDGYPTHSFCGYPAIQYPVLLRLGYRNFQEVDPDGDTALHILCRDASPSPDMVPLMAGMIEAGLDPVMGDEIIDAASKNVAEAREWKTLLVQALSLHLEKRLPESAAGTSLPKPRI